MANLSGLAGFGVAVVEQRAAIGAQVLGRHLADALDAALVAPVHESNQNKLPTGNRLLAAVAHSHRLQELVDQDLGLGNGRESRRTFLF